MRKKHKILKAVLSYVFCLILLAMLIEGTWGITVGALVGSRLRAADKSTREEISKILINKDIKKADSPESPPSGQEWERHLPENAREEIRNRLQQILKINWFAVTFAVSAFVFSIAGFLGGFLSRSVMPVGLLVGLSFLVNNPVVRFPHAKTLGSEQKILIIVAQLVFCYLFGYLGVLIGKKRDEKHLRASS